MASPFGSYAQGNDDADLWGQVVGSEVGESFGNGGLGLVGTGRGGGGNGEGTIGLGSVGTIGHNKPGDGSGMLRSTGFGDRTKRVPQARMGISQVVGGLDKDLIRRVVRAHINEVRYCYNQGLARDPNLKGRVAVQFQIGSTGKVPTAVVSESDVKDSNVGSCIASAVRRWQFPKPPGGGTVIVTYPFVLAAD
jgi:TonB family protein